MLKRELYPDVIYGNEEIKNGESIPAEIVFNKIKDVSSFKLLILGEASMGKSTFAKILENMFLSKNIPVVLWECKNINDSNLYSLYDENTTNETIYIFDGYEEYKGKKDKLKEQIERFVENNANIIVSSRYNPDEENETAYKCLFSNFNKVELQPFTEEQITKIIKDKVTSESLKSLLTNTMMLSMYLKMVQNNEKAKERLDTEKINEALFIKEYFNNMWCNKSNINSTKRLERELTDIGEYIFETDLEEKMLDPVEIPKEFCEIYKYNGKGELYSNQVKYMDFAVASYMLKKLRDASAYKNKNVKDREIVNCLKKWLNMMALMNHDALYYLGQLLSDEDFGNTIIGYLNKVQKNMKNRYVDEWLVAANGLHVFLGYNKDVAENIEGLYECDLEKASRFGVPFRVFLKMFCLKNVTIGYFPFRRVARENLQTIELCNDIYESINNCLIERKTKALVLGCANSIIPKNGEVITVPDAAFIGCKIKEVFIPSSITKIGDAPFENCTLLTNISVDENNKNYKSIDGNLYSKNEEVLIQYAIGKKDTSFTIPDGVKTIGEGAFSGCKNLETVIIPNSVTSIGNRAFDGCTKLTSIEIPDSVTNMGFWIFFRCYKLTNITVKEGNKSYKSIDGNLYSCDGKMLFEYASGKLDKTFVIPNSVTNIVYSYIFTGCRNLTSVIIPDSVTEVNTETFFMCYNLKTISIPKHLEGKIKSPNDDCKIIVRD